MEFIKRTIYRHLQLKCINACSLVFSVVTFLSLTELQSELSSSGEPTTVSTVSEGGIHRVMPEVDENIEDLGSTSQQSNVQADQKDKSQGRSGSGDKQNEPIFRATATEETESRFHGEAEQQDQSGDQQESVSGSGLDLTGANFWAVVRVEPNTVDRGSDRQLHISRRSEKSTADIAKDEDEGSASGTQTSGENVSQKSDIPDKSSSGSGVTSGSGEHVSQRSEVLITSSLDQDVVSGEDDAPFDNSSAETESDSGCSSGDGCYESDSVQGETGDSNARSVIAKAEQDAIASGSAASSGDSSSNVWLHPHFDVLAGPYDEKTSASGATPTSSGSGSVIELGSGLHDIEDAIFETGIPLQITHDAAPGSGLPSPPNAERHDDSQTSGSGIGGVEKKEDARLFKVPLHHEKMSLMEKMMKLGKLQAFQISHIATGRGRGRDQVPRLSDNDEDDNMTVHSDLGEGINSIQLFQLTLSGDLRDEPGK